jgi:HSP90 family molecular chaperone
MKFESIDIIAAIQHVMDNRYHSLIKDGNMSSKEAYLRTWKEFERGIRESMREQARLLFIEESDRHRSSYEDAIFSQKGTPVTDVGMIITGKYKKKRRSNVRRP